MTVIEQEYKQRLHSLLQITQAINSNFRREQLMMIYDAILRNQLKIPRFAIYTQTRDGLKPEVLKGVSEEDYKKINIDEYLKKINDPQEAYYLPGMSFDLFNVVVPVFHKDQPLAFVLIEIYGEHQDQIYEDIRFIQALTNIIFVAFENKNLAKEKIRQERIKKELELASEMQNMLLPSEFPQHESFEVDAFYKSHTEVGGDYYDFFQLNEDEFAICMADVSGKGISAALLMSNFQANIRALFSYIPTLEDLVKILNQKVMDSAKGEKFITAFLAKYCRKTRQLTYVNAGHNPPFLAQENRVIMLKEGSIGLGMLDELPFINCKTIRLEEDSLLVCYTDGLTELENDDGKLYGMDSLKDLVLTNRKLSARDVTTRVIMELETFKQNQLYKDDIAFLAARFH